MFEAIVLVLVVMLMLLATLDLFVGVSNDAANFLNSAVGTRIAPLFVIMLVASVGVLCGATFSSGMMEVARKGMLFPELFSFEEIMLINDEKDLKQFKEIYSIDDEIKEFY